VQEAREKLTYKSGAKPEFEYELLMMFVRNELSAAVTTPLLAIIVAMGAMFWAPPRELLLWLATVFVAKGILITLCRQFMKAPREDATTPIWRAKITAAEFFYGVTWAGVAFISPDTQGEAAHTFIFASLLVVISMRMLFASTVMPIVYAGTLPMTVAIVIRFALLDMQRSLSDLSEKVEHRVLTDNTGDAVKDLAQGVDKLIRQMRAEQKVVREWADEQAQQQHELATVLQQITDKAKLPAREERN
jgi:hypothetical protein